MRYRGKFYWSVGMAAALTGMMLSGGMTQAAGDGAAAAQQVQVTADEAVHLGAWQDFWQKLLALNQDPDSIFYHRIDVEHIGLSGHSQGGDGVFNAITSQPHHALYRTAVVLSPTNERTAAALRWTYDSTAVRTPILLLAGTKVDSISVADMKALYAKIPAPKAMAIRSGAEHGQMLYFADGYVTAWLCWQLQGDETAAKAFVGESPELLQNGCYQGRKIAGFD